MNILFFLIFCLDDPLLVGDVTKIKAKGIGQWRKEENIDAKLTQEIEKLNKDIMKSTDLLRSSKDFLIPDCNFFFFKFKK